MATMAPRERDFERSLVSAKTPIDRLLEELEAIKPVQPTTETERLQREERKRQEHKRGMELGQRFALESGKLHYKQLTDPEYDEIRKKKQEEGYGFWRSQFGKQDWFDVMSPAYEKSFEYQAYSDLNDIRQGKMTMNFPDARGWTAITPPRRPEDYLPILIERVENHIVENDLRINELIRYRSKGEDPVFGSGIPLDTPEECQKEVNRLEGLRKNCHEQYTAALRAQAEGFGQAALEHGNLPVALDNLYRAGILDKHANTVREQFMALRGSSKPEDNAMSARAWERFSLIKSDRERRAKKE